jgi:hypothetical protein
MTTTEQQLIQQAIRLYGKISPCYGRSLGECFTSNGQKTMFWFNDARGNTHALTEAEPVSV